MKHLDQEFRRYLEQELELTPEEIALASPNEILDLVLTYEGHGKYAGFAIRRWIQLIYDVDLDDISLDEVIRGE